MQNPQLLMHVLSGNENVLLPVVMPADVVKHSYDS